MLSYWEKDYWLRPYDLIIVGGGITGYSAAIEYKTYRPDLRVAIIERSAFETSASTKNAGFACFGSVTEMMSDYRALGEQGLFDLVKKRWDGLRVLRQRVGDQAMKFNECGGFELFDSPEVLERAVENIPKLNALLRNIIGGDVFKPVDKALNFGFAHEIGLIENRYEGHLNPAMMIGRLKQLARTLDIECITAQVNCIEEVEGYVELHTDNVVLKCNRSIIAVNGLAASLMDVPVKPARAQVIITEPISELGWHGTFHMDEGYYYFRNVGNRVLLGGGRNLDFEGEETDSQETTDLIQNRLEMLLKDVILPNRPFQIEQRWAGTMGVGENREPIVKLISDRVIAAVRLGGMGVAIGSLVGNQAAHLALE